MKNPRTIRTAVLATLLSAMAIPLWPSLALATEPAEEVAMKRTKPQIVLLKLDDVAKWISPRWRRTAEFLEERNIKASFGVIGQGLEMAGPETIEWIRERKQKGLVEFWLHGYKLRTATDTGEFEHGTAEEQQAILEKCQRLAKERLGFEYSAFGPHWSGTTAETEQAVQAVPSIKIWLYGPRNPHVFTRLSIPRVMALENPTFLPDFEKFKAVYERTGFKEDVLVLQGHPDAWGDPSRWEGFVKIIDYLQSQGCVFMTPSEYLETLGGSNSENN
ncbi:MAG: DUF2334 domain-containing protein [Kiritimatiellia bacterium]